MRMMHPVSIGLALLLPIMASAQAAAPMSVMPGLMLKNQNGGSATDKQFRGKPTLVYAGMSQCGKTCPLTLMTEVLQKLGKDADSIRAVFISLDEKDNPETLKAFMSRFDARIIAYYGSEQEIVRLKEAYGNAPHGSGLYLFDSGNNLAADLTDRQSTAQIVSAIEEVRNEERAIPVNPHGHLH